MTGTAEASGRDVNFCVSCTLDASGFLFKLECNGEIALNTRGFLNYAPRLDIRHRSCQVAVRSGASKMTLKIPHDDVAPSAATGEKASVCKIVEGFTAGREPVRNAFRAGDGRYACKKLIALPRHAGPRGGGHRTAQGVESVLSGRSTTAPARREG